MEAGPEAPGVLEVMGNAIKQTWQSYLATTLAKEDWIHTNSIKIIGNTKIPVLKAQTRPGSFQSLSSLSLDISFEGPGHRGLESNKLIISLLKTYPSLRPLVLVLKCFLSMKSLCEGFTGGLSSHSLLFLVVRYLQEIDHKGGPGSAGGGLSMGSNNNNNNNNINSGSSVGIPIGITTSVSGGSSNHMDNRRIGLSVQDIGALLLGNILSSSNNNNNNNNNCNDNDNNNCNDNDNGDYFIFIYIYLYIYIHTFDVMHQNYNWLQMSPCDVLT
jgi:DNA polymerase sigma